MNKNASHFKGRKVAFEVLERWSDAEKKMIRIADLVDKTAGDSFIYYELKSVLKVPLGKFAEQFVKDLSRRNVKSLDQLKWIFNGAKNPIGKDGKAFKETMEKAIENLKIDKKIAQKFGKKSPDELKDMILDNFEKIFDLK